MPRPLKVLVTTAHSLRCRITTPSGSEYEVHPSHIFTIEGDHDPESSVHHKYKEFLNRLEEPDNLNLGVCVQLSDDGIPNTLNCYKVVKDFGTLSIGCFGISPHSFSLELLDDNELFDGLCYAVDKIKQAIASKPIN